ncbi:MAG TPA: CvpA family protein [Halanaerobiales bacterium]|nr:CvpA family protein [Halanaerobiales bacterium]
MDGSITVIDIVISIILLYFIFEGYKKGFVKQTATILGILVSLYLAITRYAEFQYFLKPYLNVSETFLQFISFAVIFIGVNIVIQILSNVLEKMTDNAFVKPVNQVGGALFGLLKGGVLVYFLLLILSEIPYQSLTDTIDQSMFADRFLDLTPYVKENLERLFGHN